MTQNQLKLIVCLALTITTLASFWQVQQNEFINFDDLIYIAHNPNVRDGLTSNSFSWAFTTSYASNWHPLTWLSHMLDCQLYGLKPKGHHLNNLLFHIANTILLFLFLNGTTNAFWRSSFVAALFALHPLHVESVAWAAERKDVLSAFFYLLTMWTYTRYAKRPGFYRYLPPLLFFSLGLMAKPMVVTLPFVLILLDYWPLGRIHFMKSNYGVGYQSIYFIILEKLPFFILSVISCVITYMVQQDWGAIISQLPLKLRVANALCSYTNYITKMIWPHDLAIFYPHPGNTLPQWQIMGSVLLLIIMSLLTIRFVQSHPYALVGWLWYLGTLVPVIGIVQAGAQAMADRYTYISLIGLFIVISWGIPNLLLKCRSQKIILAVSAGFTLLVLMLCTYNQVQYWKNSITLFEHTIKVTTNNFIIHNNLGNAFARQGNLEAAIYHYTEGLKMNAENANIHNNLGNVLSKQGKLEKAVLHYSKALEVNPGFKEAQYNFQQTLQKISKLKLTENPVKGP